MTYVGIRGESPWNIDFRNDQRVDYRVRIIVHAGRGLHARKPRITIRLGNRPKTSPVPGHGHGH